VRAFGVMLGGSIALAAAAAASTVAVARAVLSRRRPSPLALFGTAATALYVLVIRPWHLRWGAQPSDERRPLPGDELFPKDGTQILARLQRFAQGRYQHLGVVLARQAARHPEPGARRHVWDRFNHEGP
jgi:hypothetical protein